jgi:hypothetical protein
MQPTTELIIRKITAEATTKTSTKIIWTPDVPWKPRCRENQLRGGFIMWAFRGIIYNS